MFDKLFPRLDFARSFVAFLAFLICLAPLAPARAAGVNGDFSVVVNATYAGANDLGSVSAKVAQTFTAQLVSGTGIGKADKIFTDTRTLAASGSETLDLAGGLTDPFGASITMTKVKVIIVRAKPTNTNNVCIGGAGSNAFLGPFADATDVECIPPGGVSYKVHPGAGWSVTSSTGDLFKVANSGGTTGVDYDVIIAGATAP